MSTCIHLLLMWCCLFLVNYCCLQVTSSYHVRHIEQRRAQFYVVAGHFTGRSIHRWECYFSTSIQRCGGDDLSGNHHFHFVIDYDVNVAVRLRAVDVEDRCID